MTVFQFARLYSVGVVTCFALDLLWLGVVARAFMQRHIGYLLRPDIQWVPAVLFYLLYVAGLVVFVIGPAIERQSAVRAVAFGAFFGVVAYAAYDLTCLALVRDYPPVAAIVDLAWGTAMTATVCGAVYASARWLV